MARGGCKAPAPHLWSCRGGREGSGGRGDAVPRAGAEWEREKGNSWHLPGSKGGQSHGETEAQLDRLRMCFSSWHCHKNPQNLTIGLLLLRPLGQPPLAPAVGADSCSAPSNSPLPGILGLPRPPCAAPSIPPGRAGPGRAGPAVSAAAAAALAFNQLGSPLSYFSVGRNLPLGQQKTRTAALRRGDFRDVRFPGLWGLSSQGRVLPPWGSVAWGWIFPALLKFPPPPELGMGICAPQGVSGV